ncbi:MAG: flagellar biosynthesis protein FlhB [Lachnospirales bacterium]
MEDEKVEINDRAKKLIPLNLSFFDDEKTESATPKKREDARKKGQVAKSMEVSTSFSFIIMFFCLSIFAEYMYNGIYSLYTQCMSYIGDINANFDKIFIYKMGIFISLKAILIVVPLFAVAMIIGVIANVIQVGWKVSLEPIMPKFSKINPLKGIKRILSLKTLLDTLKNIMKIVIISLTVYATLKKDIETIPAVMYMTLEESTIFFGEVIVRMAIQVGVIYLFIALFDYTVVRLKHEKDLRMSKQDIREEFKQSEGDPQIKGKIKQRMREAAMRRMMNDLPQADVIITNPTHYAVAIKYNKEENPAPILVAKGTDHLAKRIKEKAKEHDVEIVENKPLARALYTSCEIGQSIPPDMYKAVAEVLAYVYKLKNKI